MVKHNINQRCNCPHSLNETFNLSYPGDKPVPGCVPFFLYTFDIFTLMKIPANFITIAPKSVGCGTAMDNLVFIMYWHPYKK